MNSPDSLQISKLGAVLPVSAEAVADALDLRAAMHAPGGIFGRPLTPKEAAANAARCAELAEQRAAAHAVTAAAHAGLVAATDGALRRVVELHAPDADGKCQGCDGEGRDFECPDWPCRTIDAITEDDLA